MSDIEPQPLDPFFAVMEAARRQDELGRIRVFLPHDNVQLDLEDSAELEGLSPAALRSLQVLEPGDTLGRLYEKMGGNRFLFLKSIADLITAAVLKTVAIGPRPPEPQPSRDSLVDVLLDQERDQRLRA